MAMAAAIRTKRSTPHLPDRLRPLRDGRASAQTVVRFVILWHAPLQTNTAHAEGAVKEGAAARSSRHGRDRDWTCPLFGGIVMILPLF